jgi:two-component system cell cycle sensor histidine kinase/response regulator CckA
MSQADSENAQAKLWFERSGCACVVLALEGWRVLMISDRYLELMCKTRESAEGIGFLQLWTDQAQVRCSHEALLASLRRAVSLQEVTVRLHSFEDDAGGTHAWLERVSPVLDGDGRLSHLVHAVEGPFRSGRFEGAAIVAELDEQVRRHAFELEQTSDRLLKETAEHIKTDRALRRSEEQLRQAQKLDALGRLAGGIAHDFNNLLSVILGYSSSLVMEDGLAMNFRTQIAEVKTAAERAADLTQQLLAFSRGQMLEPQIVDLNAGLIRLEKLLKRMVGEDVELRMVLNSQTGRLRVDASQLEQVVMNLVINARDAMPTGGTLSIETDNVDLDEQYARDHLGTQPGRYVMLSVSDTGCGMDKATQTRIFEPFFTTKGPGKGTGLGLSTAFGIVKQSGGSIWVYSELTRGSSFKVYLPRVDAPADRDEKGSGDIGRGPRGDETILLVEDDAQVRRLACAVLRRAGYDVIEASAPEDALRWSTISDRRLDLLLTDVVMPKMSGRVLAEQLSQRVSQLKVLYMSGYTDDAVLRHGIVESGVAFLQKPLTPATLLRKVREVLDA